MTAIQPERRPYLVAIPPSDRVSTRLRQVLVEAAQLRILLRTAKEIENAEIAVHEESGEANRE